MDSRRIPFRYAVWASQVLRLRDDVRSSVVGLLFGRWFAIRLQTPSTLHPKPVGLNRTAAASSKAGCFRTPDPQPETYTPNPKPSHPQPSKNPFWTYAFFEKPSGSEYRRRTPDFKTQAPTADTLPHLKRLTQNPTP